MAQFAYVPKNAAFNESAVLEGITVPPKGLQFPSDNTTLNKYVPGVLNRYVDGVLNNAPSSVAGDTTANGGKDISSSSISNIVKLTQAEYDALSPKVDTTLYVIVS
jgi:hypothetical protein